MMSEQEDFKDIVAAEISRYLSNLNLDKEGTISEAAALVSDLSARLLQAYDVIDIAATNGNYSETKAIEPDQPDQSSPTRPDNAQVTFEHEHSALPEHIRNIIDQAMALRATEQAKKAARAKVANDPRQQEKELVLACWIKWKTTRPSTYKTNTAFADDMLTKCEHLKSHKKITDWCGIWTKEYNPAR